MTTKCRPYDDVRAHNAAPLEPNSPVRAHTIGTTPHSVHSVHSVHKGELRVRSQCEDVHISAWRFRCTETIARMFLEVSIKCYLSHLVRGEYDAEQGRVERCAKHVCDEGGGEGHRG